MTAVAQVGQLKEKSVGELRATPWMMLVAVAAALMTIAAALVGLSLLLDRLPADVSREVTAALSEQVGVILLLGAVAVAAAVALAVVVARRFQTVEHSYQQRMETAFTPYLAFMEHVTDGDLTTRVELPTMNTQDKALLHLGSNLNTMIEGLHAMASQLKNEAESVSAAASEILSATNEQIVAATEQDFVGD